LNKILDTTEGVVERYFPETEEVIEIKEGKVEEKHDETPKEISVEVKQPEGPLFRSGQISKRVQRGLSKKLTNLKLRTPEQLQAMKYTVDLIAYASSNLEKGVKTSNEFVSQTFHKSVELGTQQIQSVKETSHKIVDSTKTKVQSLTQDALDSVNKAIEILSKQLPTDQLKQIHSIADAKQFVLNQLPSTDSFNVESFREFVPKSVERLNQLRDTLTKKLTENEVISHPYLGSLIKRLTNIREGLGTLLTSRSSSNLLDVTQELEEKNSANTSVRESTEEDESTTSVEAQPGDEDVDQQ